MYYTQGFDGANRPGIEATDPLEELQTKQFGFRNDVWAAFDDSRAEVQSASRRRERGGSSRRRGRDVGRPGGGTRGDAAVVTSTPRGRIVPTRVEQRFLVSEGSGDTKDLLSMLARADAALSAYLGLAPPADLAAARAALR